MSVTISAKPTAMKGIKTADVRALHEAGFTNAAIARMLGVTSATVTHHMNKDLTKPSRSLDEVVIRQMQALREKGFSNAEIAEKVGCAYCTVVKKIGRQSASITRKNMSRARLAHKAKMEGADQAMLEQQLATAPPQSSVDADARVIAINVLRFVVEALNQAIVDVQKG